MNRIVGKLLVPHDTEYLAINRELLIVETSSDVKSFADCPHEVIKGKDIRLGFPELVGIEDAVMDILKGRQKSFRLEGISRCSQVNFPKYIDLYITSFDGLLIILFNDSHVLLTGKTLQVIETVPTSDGCMHHWLVFKFLFRESHRRQLVGGVAVDISDRALGAGGISHSPGARTVRRKRTCSSYT